MVRLKCGCCGGNTVELITYYDKKYKRTFVSHGICTVCFTNVLLPQVPYEEFIRGIK